MEDIGGGDEEPTEALPSLPQGGGRDATFMEFYRASEPKLIKMLMAQGACREDAQDLVVDVMDEISQRWTTITINLYTYAYRVAVHAFYDLRKAEKRRKHAERIYAEREVCDDRSLLVWEQQQWINGLLEILTVKQRQVFGLRAVERRSTAETAEILEISVEAVRTHLCAANKRVSAAISVAGEVPRQRGQKDNTAQGGTR